ACTEEICRVQAAALPVPHLRPPPRAHTRGLHPPRAIPAQVPAPSRPALPMPGLPTDLLAPDLQDGLPRPPPRSQRAPLPASRLGARPQTVLAQPPPLAPLYPAQVPQDRPPPPPPEPEPPDSAHDG